MLGISTPWIATIPRKECVLLLLQGYGVLLRQEHMSNTRLGPQSEM